MAQDRRRRDYAVVFVSYSILAIRTQAEKHAPVLPAAQVTVDRPDVQGRVEILKVHSRGKSLSKDVDLDKIARRTPGFTGADLQNLMNEAAIVAARRNLKEISKVRAGGRWQRLLDKKLLFCRSFVL